MPVYTPGPLLPKPGGGGGGGGGGESAPPAGKKGIFIGVIKEGDVVEARRAFVRFKISDLPSAATSVRLEWHYVNKTQPTGDVALIEIEDFATLDPSDWGIVEIATITATAITPSTDIDSTLSIDVTTRYNLDKVAGNAIFALKLQYSVEDEGVGAGRWYEVGATGDFAPKLVLTIGAGSDLAMTLLATPLTVELDHLDEQGTPAATVTAGEGVTYPPLGQEVRLGATVQGLIDDVDGTYTGTALAPIVRGCDIIHFLWRSTDEGSGIGQDKIDIASLERARTRLADWFNLAGGLTQFQDVRAWASSICTGIRAFTYLDQSGREAIHVEPLDSSGATPVRRVGPDEHGDIRLSPLQTESGAALYPISRLSVFYGFDYMGVAEWEGHALISSEETDPPDVARQAQATDAQTRYGLRGLGDLGEEEASPETSYPWVPLGEPGTLTGVRILDWEWDRARSRPKPAQVIVVDLPRFALSWRLLDEFEIESFAFPSANARVNLTQTPVYNLTEVGPLSYQCRRARCVVRDYPRLLAETESQFPVRITAQILAWDTP